MRPLQHWTASDFLLAAGALGAVLGVGSVALTAQGRSAIASHADALSAVTKVKRQRPPQDGDVWGGCNDARAAGTAPIYRDEPDYRAKMDGDSDGIACEPLPG